MINKVKADFFTTTKIRSNSVMVISVKFVFWREKVLKIVYINNILFIYTIFRREIIFLFWFWPKWPWPDLTGITLKIHTTRRFVLKSFWPKWCLSVLMIVEIKCFTLYQSVPLAKARKWWRVGNCFSLSVMQRYLLRQDEKMNKNQRLCSVYADFFLWNMDIYP